MTSGLAAREILHPATSAHPQEGTATQPAAERRPRILFLCTHNSARSQMAEGILRHLGGARVEVHSAGTVATRVHPLAIAAMAEKGIDIGTQRSKHLDELAAERFDYVITVCDNARESCPLFSGAPEQIHWSIPDPSAAEGDEETRLGAFRIAADDLTSRILGLRASMARPT